MKIGQLWQKGRNLLFVVLLTLQGYAENRIQLRRDTSANWTISNPILAQGEVGIETDTLKLKIGNGSSTWSVLGYYSSGDVTNSFTTNALYAGTANTASNLTSGAAINLTNGFVTGSITNTFALTNGTYANLNVGTATFASSAANAIATNVVTTAHYVVSVTNQITNAIATNKVAWASSADTATNAIQLGGVVAAGYSTTQATETARINAIGTNVVAGVVTNFSTPTLYEQYTITNLSYTLTATDYNVEATGTTATITFTLPTAVGVRGKPYTITNLSTNLLFIAPNGSQTINGGGVWTNRGGGYTIISDGANWQVKGAF